MLRIEVDIFSGRPNPVWIETDADVTRDFLNAAADARGAIAKPGTGYSGLGFRELQVTVISDDEPLPRRLPRQFAVASTAAEDFKASAGLGRRLIRAMPARQDVALYPNSWSTLG